ncbi:undecaprenyldiphospho-muramoylpentapeptide beta-N-acetylglucosaminyltransferase [Flavobacterium agricola]|uniref:UDP-N-acetylglucosamine--N-acetylmuramyl-(pentapeptide) pyrophosphoryl-undecaprenol N-acetylglucosamine transferase n=1 Tax=Flavobacterium agricola TaxID=2870839 RepID=A0ABY6M1A5_9FLAO|nr:undecaprenyldiphospho-muramoylpentapeptide beta-N-acetylglucosaminyltransferase [Flavobacterium agricola]UYW00653.1 undecaprenyldiphospho-muramoylpentapeptide beta-N-acetylglucosaminyltransferase [Flavobacterium agricola]
MSKKYKILISGGGTGGHIYPAIAIANEIKSQFPDADLLFVGAKDKMEMQKVPQAGYAIKGLWISGIQRKLTLSNLMFPFKLISSLWKSYGILRQFKPDVVVGTGGFASGAVMQVANWMHIPTVIQEQNSYPGITNKLLAKKAKAICVAYPDLERFFPKQLIRITGNPVRSDIATSQSVKQQALQNFQLEPNKKTLVVLGGSLGARAINVLVANNLEFFKNQNLQVLWQCGKFYFNEYKKYNDPANGIQVLDFIERMDLVYAAADFIISRSGASSVSELALVAKPTIFIPSPNVAEDHQTKNAQAIVDQQAALLIKEKDLENSFKPIFQNLIQNTELQQSMSSKFKSLAKPNATKEIVKNIIELI